jgi:hypothetical protein
MKELKSIPSEVAVLIPKMQLEFTRENMREFSDSIITLQARLKKCPKLYGTEKMKEHPAIFHYFLGETDIYICEYDRKEVMFGYSILNGDLDCSEWGYISLPEITDITFLNIDYYFEEQTIEAALYGKYPDYFPKPQSPSTLRTFLLRLIRRIKRWIYYHIK